MEIFKTYNMSCTFLTPNRRLSAVLLKQYNQWQMSQEKIAWPSLDILPFSSWLLQSWNNYTASHVQSHPILLSTNQELILWEEIIRKSPQNDLLLQITPTAQLVKSAWELLKKWLVPIADSNLTLTEDSQAFIMWAQEFNDACQKNNWLDINSLPDTLNELLQINKIPRPQKIILVGFTDVSPQYQNLLESYCNLGTEIIYYEQQEAAKSIQVLSVVDEETEIIMMARWAKSLYESTPNKKECSIACVIPQLETLREKTLNIFSQVFSEKNHFTADYHLLPFNISAGKSLLEFPVIHTAFEILNLYQNNIPLENLSSLLRSPFLDTAEKEFVERANFDMLLRKANITRITLQKLLRQKRTFNFEYACPKLAKRFDNFLTYSDTLKTNLPLGAWVKHFLELLTLMGWPGERSLNSHEYQVTRRWLELLVEYSTFDTLLSGKSFKAALAYLRQLSINTVFQPETSDAPIQILGILEATGLPFHHIWVMGLDDSKWPSAPKPNPFIPLKLQKKLNMPHATAARELEYSRKLLQQLKQSCEQIFLSYANQDNENNLRPSSLITDREIKFNPLLPLASYLKPHKAIFAERDLEAIEDFQGPPLRGDEIIRGGVGLFKQQAACPFKAFAEFRLHAKSIDPPSIGLRPIDRGNIIHKALELIWKEIKNSSTLKNLSSEQLKLLIQNSAAHAVAQNIDMESVAKRYLALELKRLEKLLWNWLEFEKKRPDFRVLFQEYEIKTTIGHLPMTLRVDRIDEVGNSKKIIIDYKTGKMNEVSGWFGTRLDEPQLPLYCIIHGAETIGLAFAQIHTEKIDFKGVGINDLGMKSIKMLSQLAYSDNHLWADQITHWKMTFENIAQDFYLGKANVDPKHINETCTTCRLQSFCRISEKT